MVPAFFLGRRRYGARFSLSAEPAPVVQTGSTSGYGLVWDARIIAANGAAAAGDAATVLGSASSFVGNTETGKGGSDESAFSSRDKRRFFERDSGAPFCLAKEHACGLDTKIENVQ